MLFSDTIAAISTASGSSAIAIVRLSGQAAWAIVERILFSDRKTSCASTLESHRAQHGFLRHPSSQALIDEVMVIPYKAPNSYTGEDMVEINCHGSSYIAREILSICLSLGARLARQGEFTQRSFLNGKLDLTQAEAVLDLIQSKTKRQSSSALSAMSGELGGQIRDIRNDLMELLSRVVAGIDFPEEVGETPLADLEAVVDGALTKLEQLAMTTRSGRFLRDGLKLAIAGKPNAGKSSLLNRLLQFERAIVTDVPGTTRDSLEELLDLRGIPVILVDTAGVRSTSDQVERIGIERTYRAVAESDLVLFVTDVTTSWGKDDETIAQMLSGKAHVLLANKIDVSPSFNMQNMQNIQNIQLKSPPYDASAASATGSTPPQEETDRLAVLPVSAQTGEGIEQLKSLIESWAFADRKLQEGGATLNARQGELCQNAVEALRLVKQTVANKMPQDCLATDLKTSVDSLSEICGEAVSEEIISNVFARFCIGK